MENNDTIFSEIPSRIVLLTRVSLSLILLLDAGKSSANEEKIYVWFSFLGTFGALCTWCSTADWYSHGPHSQSSFQPHDSDQSPRLCDLGDLCAVDRTGDGTCYTLSNCASDDNGQPLRR